MDAINAWMYRNGLPNHLASALNRIWSTLSGAGLSPDSLVTLQLRGRTTGRTIRFPIVVLPHDGERYLVAMLGERTNWVANVRAAGGEVVLSHGTHMPAMLEEVPPDQRAPILKHYLETTPGARPHIPVDPQAPLSEFERIAGTYPVFRIRDRQPKQLP